MEYYKTDKIKFFPTANYFIKHNGHLCCDIISIDDSGNINEYKNYYFFSDDFNDMVIKSKKISGFEYHYKFQYDNLVELVSRKLNISKHETIDRFDEFEIVKSDYIDYISLNSLFDFYGLSYNIVEFKRSKTSNLPLIIYDK